MKIMKMNRIIKLSSLAVLLVFLVINQGCKKFDYSELNGPTIGVDTTNADGAVLQTLVSGMEALTRQYISYYIDDVGVIGREHYRFSNSEPRYLSDLLGSGSSTLNNNTFYITNPWGFCYSDVKMGNILIAAAKHSNPVLISDGDRLGYYGYAKTLQAYQLLMAFNLTDSIRVDVSNPNRLGPFLGHDAALTAIAALLDDAQTDLSDPSCSFSFVTTMNTGGPDPNTPADFLMFNRALAARVAVYQKDWEGALTDLDESFMNNQPGADFYAGVYHVFSAAGNDFLNPVFFPLGATGEVRCADEFYATDILPGDDRINKAPLRSTVVQSDDSVYSQGGLTSDRDVFIYPSLLAPVAVIRNEELILLDAEANLNSGNESAFLSDINLIREGHGLADYSSGGAAADMNELIYERRYSLAFEGHRWVDMRRWGLLSQIPIEREGDHVWSEFPIPLPETY